MAVIIEMKSGKYTYLYHQYEMKRDENGIPRGKRRCVGRIDPKTNARIFKKDFLDSMKAAGTPIVEDENVPKFSVLDIKNAVVQEFGLMDLLNKTAENCGLKGALRAASPKHCDEIFMLAAHLVASGDPFMHTQDWVDNTDVPDGVGNLSSQKISRILADITIGERDGFYREWTRRRCENEYLALDITSASSYSELIGEVERGYNRDGEDLPQVNLCLLMGEKSRLPVYQASYAGSLRDVSTLKSTLKSFDVITGGKPVCVVMDKGFWSKGNVDALFEGNMLFAVAVPFTSKFATRQVDALRGLIDDFSHTIVVGNDSLRAATRVQKWGNKSVWAHVYFNPRKHMEAREKRFDEVRGMLEIVTRKPELYDSGKKYQQYFDRIEENGGFKFVANERRIEESCRNSGWLVIVSNHIENAGEMIKIYRNKDVVEKGFLRLKNSLDVGRLRVHSDRAMQSKLLIGFVALILMSVVHVGMSDNDLYKKWTMKEMLNLLSNRKVHKICGERIVAPLTKDQREIYEAFGLNVL